MAMQPQFTAYFAGSVILIEGELCVQEELGVTLGYDVLSKFCRSMWL